MNVLKTNIDAPKNEFQLVVLGDLHIGDSLCDLDLIKQTIEYIKNTKYCYVILNGDLINNALKTSKSDTYQESMSIADEQDLLVDLLEPIKNKILVMTTGNHEHRTSVLAGINPLKAVAIALGIKNKLVENSYVLELVFGNYKGIKNKQNRYIIYGAHGGFGGGRHVGSAANALQDMSLIVPNADLYVHSHTHAVVNCSDMVFLYNTVSHKAVEHQRTYVNANAFLKYGGYAEEKGYRPADRRPSAIVVQAVRKDDEMKILTNVVRI